MIKSPYKAHTCTYAAEKFATAKYYYSDSPRERTHTCSSGKSRPLQGNGSGHEITLFKH